jgi:hypothetical protein
MERNMITIMKWIATALFAGLAWLVTGYTVEYFRPFKQAGTRVRNK